MFAAVIDAAFPVFGLILTGWVCTKLNILGPSSREGLNNFVIYLALPAQLFAAMSGAELSELAQPGFFWSFALGMFGTASLYALISREPQTPPVDKLINSMSAAYGNAGFMGIPLCLMLFGKAGLGPSIITAVFTVSLLFAVTIMLIELQRLDHARAGLAIKKVVLSMLRNPLLVAPLLGLFWSIMQWPMPTPASRFIGLLGDASTPCALIAIGLFLGQTTAPSAGPEVMRIVLLKLLVQPALTALLVLYVFEVPKIWALVAILAAALPVGTGPFMLSQIYQRDAAASARAILVSTVLSVLTISILVAWIGQEL
ncbi:AEC family transporter [Zwartia vadi]|uniref:AEC family transporter n=1 Tax=Zwartia vadi TaxID=3058168 RepID=UPI0025B4F354|nr:AEC family transporter [Zwartia vadi]MDN3986326.1 AEC family transporter [Zwartia vadi]